MNRFILNLCEEWEHDAKERWIGPEESSERRRYNGTISYIAESGPEETDVLLDAYHLSDETVAAFRSGDPEKFMRFLFWDALDRKLNRVRD